MRVLSRCLIVVGGILLGLGASACSSDGTTPETGQQEGLDDSASDSLDGKADMDSAAYPKSGTYVATTPNAKVGDVLALTLSAGKTFHLKFAGDPAEEVSGTFRFTASGSSKYLRLYQSSKLFKRYAWKLSGTTLQLRLVGTTAWFTLERGEAECGGFVGKTCASAFRCVDLPADGCDPLKGGADCPGICVTDLPVKPTQKCGGFAGTTCPSGQHCEDDPSDTCDPMNGGADCLGVCVGDSSTGTILCGGFAGIQCPAGMTCEDDPNDSCDPNNGGADCGGRCVPDTAKVSCGGFAGKACPAGQHCEDDPSDTCDPLNGGADCIGVCVNDASPSKPKSCGGFANFPCPAGYVCVDNPDDQCDPAHGGADCPGMCVQGS